MRLFIAVPVPDSIKQYARMIRNELGIARADVKWVEYENYHLTLKFLGEVKESLLSTLVKNLAIAADTSPAFHLSAGGLGCFPNQMRPKVLWMGIKGEIEKAEFLGERVDSCLIPLGFEEEKTHRFHLTLGRVRSDSRLPELFNIIQKIGGKDKLRSFKVDHFQLIKSGLTASGPVYSVLEKFDLKG